MKRLLGKKTDRWYLKIGLVALVLRLILMPITAHPDIWSLNSARYFLAEEGRWNFYEYLSQNLDTSSWIKHYSTRSGDSYLVYYTYPPLSYFTSAFFTLFLEPFFQPEITPWVLENHPDVYRHPSIYKYLFLFKFPYLFFDFGIAYLLIKLFAEAKDKKRAYLLWLFNPVSLYSAYMVGQFELMPIFFVVLSLFLAQRKRPIWAAVSLGIGGAYKMFPLFFLPILAVSLGRTIWQKGKLFVLGLLPFLVSIAPFLGSAAFRSVVLFSSQSQKFLHMILPVSGAEGIYLFVFLWGIIFFSAFSWPKKIPPWLSYLAVMLIFFSVTHYHPQWFVWLTPLLVIQLVKTKFRFGFLTVVMILSWLVITLFFESSLNYGLFIPLRPSLYKAPSLAEWVGRFYDVFQLKSIVRSLFAAASVMMVFYSFKFSDEKA